MSRFELTINPDYVPEWTIQDGLRELIQNALDESTINPNNSMEVERHGNVLYISTKNAKLTKSTLLIGSTTKKDINKTIGSKGEGYKLACLVLARAGYKVIIHNYSEKEKWIPKIINSRRYNSKILVIDTEKFFWSSPPNHDLTFEIHGITDKIYNEMRDRTLFLRDELLLKLSNDNIGEVLLDESESGRVYVNGLYVSTVKDSIKYGYNLKPDKIELDRDRRAVTDFNLTWVTSDLWSSFQKEDKFLELVRNGDKDVQYVCSHFVNKDIIHNDFKEEFGEKSYPVSDQLEYENVKSTYKDIKPVIVNETRCKIVKSSSSFVRSSESFELKNKKDTPTELLIEIRDKYGFDGELLDEFNALIEVSKDW